MSNKNTWAIIAAAVVGFMLLSKKTAAATGDTPQGNNIGITIPSLTPAATPSTPAAPAPLFDLSFLSGLFDKAGQGDNSTSNKNIMDTTNAPDPVDTSLGGIFNKAKGGLDSMFTDWIAPPGGILDTLSGYKSTGKRYVDFQEEGRAVFRAGGMESFSTTEEYNLFKKNLEVSGYRSQKPSLSFTPDGELDPVAMAGLGLPPMFRRPYKPR